MTSALPAVHASSLPVWAEPGQPPLSLRVGAATGSAPGKLNEDFYGIATPPQDPDDPGRQRSGQRGIVLALADGISANGSGRFAAETTVRTLLEDFYATPIGWTTSIALHRLVDAANGWLAAENRRRPELGGPVAALSAMVVRNNRYFLAHIGDTRVYRLRGKVLVQLTVDHTWPRRDMRHVLKRAVGLDTHLVADYSDGELRAGDVFLMLTDGVWDVLGEATLREHACAADDPQQLASTLVDRALGQQAAYMGRNDATAVVVAVHRAG